MFNNIINISDDLNSKQYVFFILLIGSIILPVTLFNVYIPLVLYSIIIISFSIFGGIRKGINYLLLIMPIAPGIELAEFHGRSVGITAEYGLIALIVVLWVFTKILKRQISIKLNKISIYALLFLLICLFSLVNAWLNIGFSNIFSGIIPFIGLIENIILFIIIINEYKNRDQIIEALKYLVLGAAIAIIVNLGVYIFQEGNIYRLQSVFDSLIRKDDGYSNPNSYASYVMIICFLGFAFQGRQFGLYRVILIFLAILAFITIILSGSRSVLLAIFFSIILFAMLKRRIFPIFILVGILVIALSSEKNYKRIQSIQEIIFSKKVHKIFSEIDYTKIDWEDVEVRGYEGYGTDVVSGAMRFVHWFEGIEMVKERPIFGYGYHLKDKFSFSPTSENYFLDVWIMTGVFGLIIIILIFYRLWIITKRILYDNDIFIQSYALFYLIYLAAIVMICLTGSVLFSSKVATYFWILSGFLNILNMDEKNTIYIT